MSTVKEVQISQTNAGVIAAEINAAVAAGRTVTLNGDTPVSHHGADAATSWGTGSLSYKVAAKKPGAVRDVFVKVGHMLTISSEAPEDHGPAPHATVKPSKVKAAPKAKAPKAVEPKASGPAKAKGDKHPIPATLKGETGWLSVRTVDGHYRYAVTMDESKATMFAPGGSTDRHSKRAEAAGIKVSA